MTNSHGLAGTDGDLHSLLGLHVAVDYQNIDLSEKVFSVTGKLIAVTPQALHIQRDERSTIAIDRDEIRYLCLTANNPPA